MSQNEVQKGSSRSKYAEATQLDMMCLIGSSMVDGHIFCVI